MLGETRFIQKLCLENFLSFGPSSTEIELNSLNVLIGPNGVGKSNFIEAVDFLSASATHLPQLIRAGGGVQEWLWKGAVDTPIAEVEATLSNLQNPALRHQLSFTAVNARFEVVDEAIEDVHPSTGPGAVPFYYRYQKGHPVLSIRSPESNGTTSKQQRSERNLRREDLALDQSVLSQRRDPDLYPEITYLGSNYSRMKFYREWNLGHHAPVRKPQSVDAPNDFLLEDASNLGLVLNRFERDRTVYKQVNERLSDFYAPFDAISTQVEGGTIQVFLHEKGFNQPIPAARLSDGTLRYLCLLTILCHPTPPPLLCLEEPELGLHPDIIPTLAELLIDASHRTQLIVTTHSDILIDALSAIPEAVIVCEKVDNATKMRRLDHDSLQLWLEEYSLGGLWRSGQLGGNRW